MTVTSRLHGQKDKERQRKKDRRERRETSGGAPKIRENPITWNLELTLPDKRGVGNQICWNNARFFEYTGTNAFSRIQKVPSPGMASAQKPGVFRLTRISRGKRSR